jgi:hypothetical protein
MRGRQTAWCVGFFGSCWSAVWWLGGFGVLLIYLSFAVFGFLFFVFSLLWCGWLNGEGGCECSFGGDGGMEGGGNGRWTTGFD